MRRRATAIAAAALALALAVAGGASWSLGSRAEAEAGRGQAAASKELDRARAAHRAAGRQAEAAQAVRQAQADRERTAHPDQALLAAMHTTDDRTMEGFFRNVYDWDSSGAYAAARDRARSRYGLPGDGEFLTRFMAPPQCHESARHERFCVIDTQHLASSYSSLDSMMTAYSDGTRSYAGAVSSCSYSADGSSCAERSDRFVWTIGPQDRLLAVDWLDANP